MWRSATTVFNNFGGNATSHGVGRIASSKHVFRRCIWLFMFLLSLAYVISQIVDVWKTYYRYPVAVNTRQERVSQVEFPGVTICNRNALRMSKVMGSRLWSLLMSETNDTFPSNPIDMRDRLVSLLLMMNATARKAMGHQQDDLIIQCLWKGKPCQREFGYMYSSYFGNCFTFNSNEQGETLKVKMAGEDNALQLTLNLELWEYVGQLTPSVGLVIEVHHPAVLPFPNERGKSLPPGHSIQMGLTAVDINILGDPYRTGGCNSPNTPTYFPGKLYTSEACMRGCIADAVKAVCGCVPASLPLEPKCDPLNKTQASCSGEAMSQDFNARRCGCPPVCREMAFETELSSSIWPSPSYYLILKKSNLSNTSANQALGSLFQTKENLLTISVYYTSLNIKNVTEEAGYPFVSALGDIGGNLGFFVGMSVLSIMEFIELLVDLLASWFRRDSDKVTVARQGTDD